MRSAKTLGKAEISLASSLAAYVRKGEIFTRPAPNTFGLVELGHKTIIEEEAGPPAGFGQITPKVAPTPPPSAAASAQKPQQPEEPIDDDIPF